MCRCGQCSPDLGKPNTFVRNKETGKVCCELGCNCSDDGSYHRKRYYHTSRPYYGQQQQQIVVVQRVPQHIPQRRQQQHYQFPGSIIVRQQGFGQRVPFQMHHAFFINNHNN